MQEIFSSERIFSGYPQGRADSWITIWHMLCGYPKKESVPCNHMVAIVKVGAIATLTRIAIMPYWFTKAQWHLQFPEEVTYTTHITLTSIRRTQAQLTTSSIARRGLQGRRRVTQRNSNAGWGSPTTFRTWQRRGGGLERRGRMLLVMLGSHLYWRKTRSRKDLI